MAKICCSLSVSDTHPQFSILLSKFMKCSCYKTIFVYDMTLLLFSEFNITNIDTSLTSYKEVYTKCKLLYTVCIKLEFCFLQSTRFCSSITKSIINIHFSCELFPKTCLFPGIICLKYIIELLILGYVKYLCDEHSFSVSDNSSSHVNVDIVN